MEVPEVLRSGRHEAIAAWRRDMAETATRSRRPDLMEGQGEPDGSAPGRGEKSETTNTDSRNGEEP
jgi:tRNA G37 N-methylase TrmD